MTQLVPASERGLQPRGRPSAGAIDQTSKPVPDWRLVTTPAFPGAYNMAVDVALTESVQADGAPVLRFYRWWPPCISLGRNQMARGHYDVQEAERRRIEFVRRPTGGRAVYHHHEITYSVIVRDRAFGGPRKTYRLVHRSLAAGLRLMGIPVDLAGDAAPALRPTTVPCFGELDGGAIIADGRKLAGSAQLRQRGVLLQHGSILLGGDQSPALDLLKVQRSADALPAPIALSDLLERLPDWQDMVDTLALGFERVLGLRLSDSNLTAAELARVEGHAAHFSDPEWTWRL